MFFHVNRSIIIDRDIAEVYQSVGNFANWAHWSPWQKMEPDCSINISGDAGTVGHKQEWDGTIIGSGYMSLSKTVPNELLDSDLIFLKPWKSNCTSGFQFKPADKGTEVIWKMRGFIPFFLFFLKKGMVAYVESDFERGLAMLKEYLETGGVKSNCKIKGKVERPSMYCIGKRSTCVMKSIGPAMQEDFAFMDELVEKSALPAPKMGISLYHKFDIINGKCDYTSGFLYDSPQNVPDGCVAGEFPAHSAVCVEHKGSYRHLGNAGATAASYARTKHRANKAIPIYELYINDPRITQEEDLLVEFYVPVKS